MEKQYLFVDEHICDICGEKFDDKKRRDDIRLGEIKEFVVKCEMCLKEFIVKERELIIIEYDGIWHFNKEIYERLGTPEKYVKVLEKDKKLKEYCEINNTRLLRISDKHYSHNKIKSKLEILDFIEKTDLQYLEL